MNDTKESDKLFDWSMAFSSACLCLLFASYGLWIGFLFYGIFIHYAHLTPRIGSSKAEV